MTAPPLVQCDGAGQEDVRAAEGSYLYTYMYGFTGELHLSVSHAPFYK